MPGREEAAAASRWTSSSRQLSGITILETKARAKRAVRIDVDGEERRIKKGAILDPSELIVKLIPDAFETVSRKADRR